MARNDIPEYRIWKAMKSRCYAPSGKDNTYQKNGVQVCPRWRNSFEAFFEDMGPRPGSDYSIERVDVYGDYCPENCTWIPLSDQSKNRRFCLVYTINGETHNLKEWSRICGIKYTTVYMRIFRSGWSVEKSLEMKGE